MSRTEPRLAGRVALVTGAARAGSIGRAIALALAEEGADVAVNDHGRGAEAEEVAAGIRALGRRAAVVEGDVRDVAACRRIVAEAAARLGRLDVLVNNAGMARHAALETITEAEYDDCLALHLKGPFFLAQAAAPHLRASGDGRIVNIGSEQGYTGYPDLVPYAAAKAGLRAMTKSLALALAPAVRVNAVCPGPTATERFMAGPEYTDAVRDALPLRRWGTPRDVAGTVVFLASPDGDAYTGQTLDPNCGAVMP